MTDREKTCRLCEGRGHLDVCPHCNGTGVTNVPDLTKLPVVSSVTFMGEEGRIDKSLFGTPALMTGNESIAEQLERFLKATGNYTGPSIGPIRVRIEFLRNEEDE